MTSVILLLLLGGNKMIALVLNKLEEIKMKVTSDWILSLTEKIFYMIPCLFLGYLFLLSLETKLGILSPVQHNPIYTVYFITFLSFFFCGFLTRQIRILKDKDEAFVKLGTLLLLASQLVMLNMICAAMLIFFIKKEFSWDIRHIPFRQLKWRWQLALCFYIATTAFMVFIVRQMIL